MTVSATGAPGTRPGSTFMGADAGLDDAAERVAVFGGRRVYVCSGNGERGEARRVGSECRNVGIATDKRQLPRGG